ncbi:hypothetical protein Tco_1440998, partial [Tanacetum coccineum]
PIAPLAQKAKQVPHGVLRQPNVQSHSEPIVKGSTPPYCLKPTLALHDDCLVNRDLDNWVMGEVLFARKRICVKTNHVENILESFKLVVKGKVFWARAKELFVWSPSFKEVPTNDACSDEGSVKVNEEVNGFNNGDEDSDNEAVLDTYFGDNGEDQGCEQPHGESKSSPDPFTIMIYSETNALRDARKQQVGQSSDLKAKLCDIDKELDQGGVSDDILLSRMEIMKQLHDIQSSKHRDLIQKAKIRWAIEGDENSKYFHAIINKKRINLSVKGIMVDGDWIVDPSLVKQEFRCHFAERFLDPGPCRGNLDFLFPNRLNDEQVLEMEAPVSYEINPHCSVGMWRG